MGRSHELRSLSVEPPFDAALGAIRHGAHICAFYETNEDLLDLVSQFCAVGARRGDLCVWMRPKDVDAEPLAGAGVELHCADDAYQGGGSFQSGPVVAFWHDKLAEALAHDHTGLSASGHTCWLQQRDWQAFMEYENELNSVIAGKPISLLCTYPLSSCKAGDILDVLRAHEVAIAKQQKHWSVIESHLTDETLEALDVASRVSSLSPRTPGALADRQRHGDEGHRRRTRPQRPHDRGASRARHPPARRTHHGRSHQAADAGLALGALDGHQTSRVPSARDGDA